MLQSLNLEASKNVGIATQNLIEELYENLMQIGEQERELDVIHEEDANETGNSPISKGPLHSKQHDA